MYCIYVDDLEHAWMPIPTYGNERMSLFLVGRVTLPRRRDQDPSMLRLVGGVMETPPVC